MSTILSVHGNVATSVDVYRSHLQRMLQPSVDKSVSYFTNLFNINT